MAGHCRAAMGSCSIVTLAVGCINSLDNADSLNGRALCCHMHGMVPRHHVMFMAGHIHIHIGSPERHRQSEQQQERQTCESW